MAFDLLAPFTGAPITDAAQRARDFALQQQATGTGYTQGALGGGLAALTSGAGSAAGAIGGGTATGRSDIGAATPAALSALYGGQDLGSLALTGAVSPAISALGSGTGTAIDAYNRLIRQVGGADTANTSQAWADALGLNGPEGTARAQAGFQAGPGFQFALGQGTKALTQSANAAGMAAGGNTARAAEEFGVGLGQQAWQQYIDNLRQRAGLYAPLLAGAQGTAAGGIANAALTGGTGAANIYTGTGQRLSDLYSGTGTRAAGTISGAGQTLADLASKGGLATGNVYEDAAAREAALYQGLNQQQIDLLKSTTGAVTPTYAAEGTAGMLGPTNLWNLGISGARAAASGGL